MKQLFRKARLSIAVSIGVLAMSHASAWAAVTIARELPDGTQFAANGGTLRIQFWSQDIVRVPPAPGGELPPIQTLSVVATPAAVRLTRQENGQAFTLATPRIKVQIDKRNGAVSFLDPAGKVILRE